MKKTILVVASALVVLVFGCSSPLDNKVNSKDYSKIVEIIQGMDEHSAMKKQFIIDNLQMQLGFYEIGRQLSTTPEASMTFREVIEDLAEEYEEIRNETIQIRENNKKLEAFARLVDARALSLGRYEGYINLDIEFENTFGKDILYTILRYRYVDQYDQVFFDEQVRITDQVAEDFDGVKGISIKEEYNSVARFMYSEVPIRARQELREELGEEKANEKAHRDFLMNGLKIEPVLVVFKDGEEVSYVDHSWEYF